jgi:hypothetical protein
MRQPHTVPTNDVIITVLEAARTAGGSDGYVFKGRSKSRLSHRSLERFLHATMAVEDVAFFSTFAHEQTEFAHELIELCLAHQEGRGNAVARAYNRGTAIERRRALMSVWADFVTEQQAPSNVIPLPAARR